MAFIPSPPVNGVHIGPAFIHFYGLMYVVGITLAIIITRRRWQASGGDPALVAEVATWAVQAGIIGARMFFDITTPADIPPHWWGVFAVWSGGLGVWGGIAAGAAAGVSWRVRRRQRAGVHGRRHAGPAGRPGGRPDRQLLQSGTVRPADQPAVGAAYRAPGPARRVRAYPAFQPTFLYELIFDLALAAALVWLGHHRPIRPPGLFALYVAGYSAFRIFEESLRIDSSEHFLGLRLNFYIACALTLFGLAWFARTAHSPPGGQGRRAGRDRRELVRRYGRRGHAAHPGQPAAMPIESEPGSPGGGPTPLP